MANQHSFRKLLPGFVISAGTQVVLKVAKALADGEQFNPPGSVGVVLESPPDNHQPYLVRFADGETVTAYFHELALRRREVEDELGEVGEDLRPWIIYRCQVGSKAFGLAAEDSDDDLRGIYLPPAKLHWSLRRLPEQLEFADGQQDEVYWELEKFLRLALKANPSVLETLWTPLVLLADETAQELRAMRQAFLSKHVYKTYSGYVLSQFRRMANAYKAKGTYKPKHAMHLIRLLYSGIAALDTGEVRIDVAEQRDELLHIRSDGLPFEVVKRRTLELDERFQAAFERTMLPEQPDYAHVDAFLVRAEGGWSMLDVSLDAMRQVVKGLDYGPLFVTVSGAHLYGFPSPDSDVDLRGCHLLPLRDVVGIDVPPLTLEHKSVHDGTEVELVSHETRKYLRLLLRNNGYILEQIFSPIVVMGQAFLDELRPLACNCITRNHYHHYRGFYATHRKLIAKEEPKRAKPVLYAYRVLMTGIHLLRSGEVEANLPRLNEHFRFEFLDELIARKVGGENTSVGDLDWSFHEARLAELEAQLDRTFQESKLPDDRDRKPISEFLVRLRLGQQ